MTLKDAQMKAVTEERDNFKHDLDNSHMAKDELIKKVKKLISEDIMSRTTNTDNSIVLIPKLLKMTYHLFNSGMGYER